MKRAGFGGRVKAKHLGGLASLSLNSARKLANDALAYQRVVSDLAQMGLDEMEKAETDPTMADEHLTNVKRILEGIRDTKKTKEVK